MLQIPYETIVEAIVKKTGKDQSVVEAEIKAKLDEFSGLISQEGAAHIIANEEGIDLTEESKKPLKISQLKPGMKGVSFVSKIVAKYDVNTFERNGQEGKVQSMIVGDETGKTRLTFWHDDIAKCEDLAVDDIISVTDVSTRENQGRVDVSVSSNSQIEKNPDGVEIDVAEGGASGSVQTDAAVVKIATGTHDATVSILGPIVQVFPPYYYMVEKNDGKRVKDEEFDPEKHEYNFVLNVAVDDGSESIRVACFNDQALDIAQASREEFVACRDDLAKFSDFKKGMLGRIVKLVGKINKNEQYDRLEFRTYAVDVNPDPKKEMERFA